MNVKIWQSYYSHVVYSLCMWGVFCGLAAAQESLSVDYNRDVRPILSNNCFFCHGFDEAKREAGLRLDTFEGATENDGIVPGDTESSLLVERIFSDDPDSLMPPTDSAYALTDAQKDVLKRWVEQGGKYDEHWSYRKLVRPKIPQSNSKSPIDAFLDRKRRRQRVASVGKATPREILRRLSFDLRGLPPTYEQVEQFKANPSDAKLQEFASEWIGSMEFAEHQGLLWLDLVRWGDSSGMVSDEPIATGKYRAWVINAFRKNMPFDQFTREQLAGDLLADQNDATIVASGYNRLVKTNSEAGVIEKEALHALKGEHVRALGTVWLGATTGCAECHDHKYDPITARDYYSMAAFFDDLIEIGVYEPGDRRYPIRFLYDDHESRVTDDRLSLQVEQIREQLYGSGVSEDRREEWEAEQKESLGKVPERDDFVWMPQVLPPAHLFSGGYTQTKFGRESIAADGELKVHSASETMTGFCFKISDGKTRLFFNTTIDEKSKPDAIAVQIIHGDYQRQGWLPDYFTTYFWGDKSQSEKFASTVKDPRRIVHVGPLPQAGKQVRLVIDKNKIMSSPHEEVGLAWMQVGGKVTWGDSGFNLTGKNAFAAHLAESTIRYWWELPQNRDDRENKMRLVADSLAIKNADRRKVHQDVIRFAVQEHDHPDAVANLRDAYRELYRLRATSVDIALVSKTGPRKETRLRNRGNFMDESGPILEPAVPEFLGPISTNGQIATRLDLANWLTDKSNPVTARVFVNRLWHQFYGRGLSETLEDAGNQGDWPSHPDLVDWLAVELIESQWNVQHVIKLLVSAKAYQLSSIPTPEMVRDDPANRLHSRQSRHRLTAEEIRDAALSAAGLIRLTSKVPSNSFFPYQPQAYWEKSNKIMYGSRYLIWDTTAGDSQYQRSLYTFWKRQNPHPSLLAFDAPTRQECTAKRATTNTPGQALALLNDPVFVEAAKALAEKMLKAGEANSDEQRIAFLFRSTLQRSPTEMETEHLSQTLAEFRELFKENTTAATNLLAVGQMPADPRFKPEEHAAWTAVCRIILNLHEFITRS